MSGAAQPQRCRSGRGRASFFARVVEASGAEWFPAEDDVSDPGVALDVARSLEPKLGPTVLRVVAPGDEYRRVAGDWLEPLPASVVQIETAAQRASTCALRAAQNDASRARSASSTTWATVRGGRS